MNYNWKKKFIYLLINFILFFFSSDKLTFNQAKSQYIGIFFQ